jgi:transcriptional regulator with XRE-family HTH domain
VLRDSTVSSFCAIVVELLQKERLKRDLSMNAVAERAGLSQQMVSYVERGLRRPTLDTLFRIAYALEVDLGSIMQQATAKAHGKRR